MPSNNGRKPHGWNRSAPGSIRRQRGGSGWAWARIRQQVIDRDGGICQICGIAKASTVDHILPVARGGSDDLANLRAACVDCNLRLMRESRPQRRTVQEPTSPADAPQYEKWQRYWVPERNAWLYWTGNGFSVTDWGKEFREQQQREAKEGKDAANGPNNS